MLIDTHAHLYWEDYTEDLDEVIKRSIDAGVSTIINVGVDVEKSKQAIQVSKKLALSGVEGYSTIGIHPHEAVKLDGLGGLEGLEEDIRHLEQIYKSNPQKVVAVGECGLDYFPDQDNNYKNYKNHNYYNNQKKLFQAQIDLAKKLNLPLLVHCREAWDEVLEMVGNHPAILHCYSGLLPTTNYILQTTNLIVSFAGNITYPKNEYLREAAKLLPLDRIVLETDCPFLPPQSKRGQRNEPANILEIARLIAQLKGISLDEVAKQTTANAAKILAF